MTTTSAPSARRQPQELDRLVGGDRAAHPEADQPALEAARHAARPSQRRTRRQVEDRAPVGGRRLGGLAPVASRYGSPPATSAWRIARPLRVRSGSMRSTPTTSAGPRRGGQAAGEDRADASGASRGLRELGARPRNEPATQRLVPEHRAGLHRADGVAADHPVGRPELDPRQLCRARGERLEPELEARGDRAADVRAVRADAVERRRGPEVDDDGRRPVEAGRRERVDDPVGAHEVRPVHADRRSARSRPRRRGSGSRGGRDARSVAVSGGHDRREGHRRDAVERVVVEARAGRAAAPRARPPCSPGCTPPAGA